MSKLFEPGEINGMVLANRFVRSATWEAMATDDGACTPHLINLLAVLARGGVGLINRWRPGDLKKARCVSYSRCFEPVAEGGSVRCAHNLSGLIH